ncbi:MAG: hypothetical protein KKC75_03565 [Nanoarchaeota archaeon]|nr:hypothetical protein [Nanoarchaeota archaeon]MBU1005124.1 hypothetical protein [Nanoarchaeota archaeon]MBU1946974.1 hypothetical protein [Nanoarchaeota archaeon]
MQVFGNIGNLKRAIEKKYSDKVKQAEKERDKQLEEIDRELKKKISVMRSHSDTVIETDSKRAFLRILSEERLKAKSEFEAKREKLIESVFKEAAKKAKDVAHSKRYAEYVKSNMPDGDGFSLVGDDKYYMEDFPGIAVEKGAIGIRVESEGMIYDFTLDNIIESKKEALREEVSKALFE